MRTFIVPIQGGTSKGIDSQGKTEQKMRQSTESQQIQSNKLDAVEELTIGTVVVPSITYKFKQYDCTL